MAHRLLFLLLTITSIKGLTKTKEVTGAIPLTIQKPMKCSSLSYVNNMYYLEFDRKKILGTPSDLHIRFKTNDIYFTHVSKEMRISLQIWHPDGTIETIQVRGLGQSCAIDNLHDVVYLATDNGVYTYSSGVPIPYTTVQEDVMYIAVDSTGEVVYIATWPQNRVSKITKSGARIQDYPIIPNGRRLTIDINDNIYFDANKTWYVLLNGEDVPVTIRGLPTKKNLSFDALNSKVFAMDDEGYFYSVSPENATAKVVGHFDLTGVNTFAVDSSYNVVVGTANNIIKYAASYTNPCQDERK